MTGQPTREDQSVVANATFYLFGALGKNSLYGLLGQGVQRQQSHGALAQVLHWFSSPPAPPPACRRLCLRLIGSEAIIAGARAAINTADNSRIQNRLGWPMSSVGRACGIA